MNDNDWTPLLLILLGALVCAVVIAGTPALVAVVDPLHKSVRPDR